MKKALISGIAGQDGSYLAELLLEKGYEVHGIVRHSVNQRRQNIAHLEGKITLHQADLLNQQSLVDALREVRPDEVYNLAAQSFVPESFREPELTAEITGLGVLRMLEAVRQVDLQGIKLYQASSSEMFGNTAETPQKETTPFYPRSPYGAAKAFGHYLVQNYRESYGMFACSGIAFNHESPRRGPEFVTRKITQAVARIKKGRQDKLALGNIVSARDWTFAGDVVRAMWMMLQAPKPKDYVIASGVSKTVISWARACFDLVGLHASDYFYCDRSLQRPAEVNVLCGDAGLIGKDLGWAPLTSFYQLAKMMVDADLAALE